MVLCEPSRAKWGRAGPRGLGGEIQDKDRTKTETKTKTKTKTKKYKDKDKDKDKDNSNFKMFLISKQYQNGRN